MKNLHRLNPYNSERFSKESKLVFLSPERPKRATEIKVTPEQKKLKEKLDKGVKAVSKQFLKNQPGKTTKEKAKNFMNKYEKKPMRDIKRVDDIKSWLTSFKMPDGRKPFDPHSRGEASFYTREYANKLDSQISNIAYAPAKKET